MRLPKRLPALLAAGALVGSSLLASTAATATPLESDPATDDATEEVTDETPDADDPAGATTETLAAYDAPASIGDLTVFGTTDVHGNLFNWDYFADAPPAKVEDQRGLVRVASAIEAARAAATEDSVLVLDNGDFIQGTPLTYLAALRQDDLVSAIHPMAEALNVIGYDAQNLGNHEFNYGLDLLAEYMGQINAPLLGANVHTLVPGAIEFDPYTIIEKTVGGETVKIGVLGLVTPGVRIWDKAHVEGILEFEDLVLAAQREVPKMKAEGAEIIIALVHSGKNAAGVPWDPTQLQENVATSVATLVNDIDVVIGGHSHVNIPSEVFEAPDGDPVLFTQPYFWARSTSQISLPIASDGAGAHSVAWPETTAEIAALAVPQYAKDLADSPSIANHPTLPLDHAATIAYVNSVIATNLVEITSESSRYEDTPILDIIGFVMENAVKAGLAGTEYADLPVIAQTSPFSRTAVFPEGDLRVRDVAGLYIYDNTLAASLIDGAQLKDYLEFSARFFVQATEDNPWDPETHTNALYEGATRGIPDYNYDALTGAVAYELDITKPVGERVVNFRHADGTPVADDDQFVLAINNYRQSGGGGYPVGDLPSIGDEQLEIRQLIIEYAQETGEIHPDNFHVVNWELITEEVEDPSTPPTTEPTEEPTSPSTDPTTPTDGTSTGKPDEQPGTGANVLPFVFGSIALIALGGAGVAISKRRSQMS